MVMLCMLHARHSKPRDLHHYHATGSSSLAVMLNDFLVDTHHTETFIRSETSRPIKPVPPILFICLGTLVQ